MACLGVVVLAGWVLNIDALKEVATGLSSMKVNTALGFVAFGAGLAIKARPGTHRAHGVANLLLAAVVLLGLATLAEYLTGVSLGIDQALLPDPSTSLFPGRPSPLTAACFVLAGLAGLTLDLAGGVPVSEILVVPMLGICLLVATAFAYGARVLGGYTQMALHTALGFMVASGALLAARPDRGVLAILWRPTTAGRFARLLLPVAVLVPILFGWVRAQIDGTGLQSVRLGITLYACSMAVGMVAVTRVALGKMERVEEAALATERERAAQLERKTKLIDAAELATTQGSWEWDTSTDHAVWSAGMYRLFGLDPSRFDNTNENFLAMVHPDDRARMGQAIADALKQPGPFYQEYRLTRPDGARRSIRGRGNVLVGPDGKATVMYGIVEDVTERHRLESLLAGVMDNTTDAVYVKDLEGKFLLANRAMARSLGKDPADLVGLDGSTWSEPSAFAAGRRDDAQVLASGKPTAAEFSLALPGAEGPRTFSSLKVPFRDATGSTVGIIGVMRDITPQHQAQEALRRSEARFRSLFATNPVAMAISRFDGSGILDANDEYVRLLGYGRAALLAPGFDLSCIWAHPEEREKVVAGLRQKDGADGLELALRRADGTVRDTLASVRVIEVDGQPCFLVALQDRTEAKASEGRARAERERRVADEAELDRMHRTDAFRTEFINSTSHELTTPLTPLVIQMRMMAQEAFGPLTQKQAASIALMQRNLARLQTISQDMVHAAALQARTLSLEASRLDVAAAVREALANQREAAARAGLRLAPPPPGPVMAWADPAKLQVVLRHLLGNAIKFTGAGGAVTVAVEDRADTARVAVTDTGIGLTDAQREGLWRPYAQAHDKNQRTDSGPGLGLYVTKGLVALHGGEVGSASPGPGKGSTFWFTLPKQALPGIKPVAGPAMP